MRTPLLVGLLLALSLPTIGAARRDYVPVPAGYRYAGIVGTLAWPALHAIFVGMGSASRSLIKARRQLRRTGSVSTGTAREVPSSAGDEAFPLATTTATASRFFRCRWASPFRVSGSPSGTCQGG